jgi:hypothetical protein
MPENVNVQARFQITAADGTSLNGEYIGEVEESLARVLHQHYGIGGRVMVANMWRGEMAGQVIPGGALAVTISWPDDTDRGSETYGPFASVAERDRWVDDCIEASKQGWRMLDGARYLLHRIETPFDPTALWENNNG